MRRFWLKKGSAVWDLSSDTFIGSRNFMADPQGLGVRLNIDSFEVQRATFVEKVELQRGEIRGLIYFEDYAQFSRFAEFLGAVETHEPLRLYYSTAKEQPDFDSIDEWYRLVLVQELQKGEIDFETGKLICEVRFVALSRWRRDRLIVLELSPVGGAHTFPYVYNYFYGGQNNMAVDINNDGNLPSHCVVRADAETDTPHFRVIQNGQIVEQARYNIYIRPGQHMVINSDPANQEASLYTGTHREDIYYLGERNYEYSNFITIPSGRSLFLFTARNSQFGRVRLEWAIERAVI